MRLLQLSNVNKFQFPSVYNPHQRSQAVVTLVQKRWCQLPRHPWLGPPPTCLQPCTVLPLLKLVPVRQVVVDMRLQGAQAATMTRQGRRRLWHWKSLLRLHVILANMLLSSSQLVLGVTPRPKQPLALRRPLQERLPGGAHLLSTTRQLHCLHIIHQHAT